MITNLRMELFEALVASCDWCRSGLVTVTVTRGDGDTCGGLLLTKHHVLASAACLGNREAHTVAADYHDYTNTCDINSEK